MSGYRRVAVVGTGAGAREVLAAAIDIPAARDRSEVHTVGSVHRVYDRSAYLRFDVDTDRRGPSLALLCGPEFDGPLDIRVETDVGVAVGDLGFEAGDAVRVTGTAGDGQEVVIAVGPSLAVTVDDTLCRPAGPAIPVCRDLAVVGRSRPVQSRARAALDWLEERTAGALGCATGDGSGTEAVDGLGWVPALSRALADTDAADPLAGQDPTAAGTEPSRLVEGWVGLLTDGSVAAALDASVPLLGRGPGATPSGDDILSGLLVALVRTTDGPTRRAVTTAGDRLAARAAGRTTDVSAALLAQAACGRSRGEVRKVLEALLAPDDAAGEESGAHPAPERELGALAAVGHSSGVDTLVGTLIAVLLIAPAVDAAHGTCEVFSPESE